MKAVPHRLYKVGTRLTVTENSKQRMLLPHSICFSAGQRLYEAGILQHIVVIRNGKKGKIRSNSISIRTPIIDISPFNAEEHEYENVIDMVENSVCLLDIMDYDTLDFLGWASSNIDFLFRIANCASNKTRNIVLETLNLGAAHNICYAYKMLDEDKESLFSIIDDKKARSDIIRRIRISEAMMMFPILFSRLKNRRYTLGVIIRQMCRKIRSEEELDDNLKWIYDAEREYINKMRTKLIDMYHRNSDGKPWLVDHRYNSIFSKQTKAFDHVYHDLIDAMQAHKLINANEFAFFVE